MKLPVRCRHSKFLTESIVMGKSCTYCHRNIDSSEVSVGNLTYHPECLTCQSCGKSVLGKSFRMKGNQLYCNECFRNVTAVVCAECKRLIKGKQRIQQLGQYYHPGHFICFNCKLTLTPGFYKKITATIDNETTLRGICNKCVHELKQSSCPNCGRGLRGDIKFVEDHYEHEDCSEVPDEEEKPAKQPSGKKRIDTSPNVVVPGYTPPNTPLSRTSSSSSSSCSSIDELPAERLTSRPSRRWGSTTDSMTETMFARIPDQSEVMNDFESQGNVRDRSAAFGKSTLEPSQKPDIMEGFESQGNVRERSAAFGKKPEEKEGKERELHGFESQGSVLERSAAFGKSTLSDPEEKEKQPEGFVSSGNVAERASLYDSKIKSMYLGDEEEKPKEVDLNGFESQGRVVDRSNEFGKSTLEEAQKEDILNGFESQGRVVDRSNEFGKSEPKPKEKKELHGFESQGNVRERSAMFGKAPKEEEEPKEKKELQGFESQGSVRDRSSMFGRSEPKKEAIDEGKEEEEKEDAKPEMVEEEGEEEKEEEDAKPEAMEKEEEKEEEDAKPEVMEEEEKKEEEAKEGISDSESDSHEDEPVNYSSIFASKAEKETQENAESDDSDDEAEQERLEALPRDQLKVYPLEVLQGTDLPKDVDRSRKQFHLSDEEFYQVFGKTKDEFSQLSQGKQNWERKRHHLF